MPGLRHAHTLQQLNNEHTCLSLDEYVLECIVICS